MTIDTHVLLADLVIGESPRWHDGRLWFCHWGADEIVAVDADGKAEVLLADHDLGPHSIDWLPDGRMLLVAKGRPGLLLRREPDGSFVTHADLRGLAAGWNELVVDGRGNVYVNGSDFDLIGFFAGTAEFVPGVIALVTPDGEVRQVADGIRFGNGMAVTPDGRTLILADSFANALVAFDIEAGGGLTGRRVWAADLTPDGICIDADGAVWTSSASFGRGEDDKDAVRVAQGGEILDRIPLDRSAFALMLGGDDGRTLFVMEAVWDHLDPWGGPRTGQVRTARAPSAGAGWPAR
ncbi:SMP-30/gluconolactonase/LRE family protein [Pseudonocardia abyssalis]|uniref:SMP-30/gluconolactonase/LRE family protein n=1 Tax=Pseudonocardia abyssalis TaxID=2792008 RepID=A0ABS6UX75_9PSEU|nr:SMP-30/gluconolactonase/LRE family protein [Pseudonocardia abyssalis]MBW0115413.1 SMP-30/gluconolactonase/LRE family protein [Pseudonocardia abyssalis]MBW0136839.1 SMP-30/gluconolactonase/LRE family protein [Pseudonocardia abyssalis]